MVKDYYIKNMVCNRCIKVLKNEINAQGIIIKEIELGRLRLDIKAEDDFKGFKQIIVSNGFQFIDSVEEKMTEQVKILLIDVIENLALDMDEKLSTYLGESMNQDYSKISKVFSFTEGITIEKYFIKLKIEKVKEFIQTREQNFTEISQLLDYSNITHLSNQFKAETGMSLTAYKTIERNFRNPLDQII